MPQESVSAGGVTLIREVPSYQGLPQVLQFCRQGGIQDDDYIEFYIGSERKKWEWCKGKTSVVFEVYDDAFGPISVKFCQRGGWLVSGKLVVEMSYTLENPLSKFVVSQRDIEVGRSLVVSYKSECNVTDCCIILKRNGLRLSTYSPETTEGQYSIQVPRLPGHCEIVFIARISFRDRNSTGDIVLGSKMINVTDEQHLSETKLWFDGYPPDRKILTVPNNLPIQVNVSGSLLCPTDCVVVLPASGADCFLSPPSQASLQFPFESHAIGSGGSIWLEPHSEGAFYICLALEHDSHAKLLGTWITLIASDRVGCSVLHTNEGTARTVPGALQTQILPSNPPPLTTHPTLIPIPTPTARFTCVICCDLPVSIKYDPCKHVCVCESCNNLLSSDTRRGIQLSCPICRTNITTWEKVFIS